MAKPAKASKASKTAKSPVTKVVTPKSAATVRDTAEAFTKLLKAGDHEAAAKQFNAAGIVSIEAMDGPMARVEGRAGVEKKAQWWYDNHTVHSVTTEGPYVNGTQFAVRFAMDVTEKASGKRSQMQEVAVYTVKAGKIVEERFYY